MIRAYILIQTEIGKASEVGREVSNVQGVIFADAVTGPYDVVAVGEARDVDALGRLVVSGVQGLAGITRTVTCLVVRL